MTHKVYLLAFLIGTVPMPAHSQNSQQLNLKNAVHYALSKSPRADSAKRELNISDMEQSSSFYRFFPILDLTSTHGLSGDLPRKTGQAAKRSEFNLSLTENLFDNGVTYTQHQISKLKEKQAQYKFQLEQNRLCYDVANQFIKYTLASKSLEIQRSQHALIKKQFEMASRDYYQGLRTRKDYLRLKTQVSRSSIELVSSESRVAKAEEELKKSMGVPLENTDTLAFTPENLEFSPEAKTAQEFAIEDQLAFKSSALQKQILELETSLVSRKYWPEVFLTAGAVYESSNYWGSSAKFSDNDRASWNTVLTLKYTIFDWGVKSRDRQIAYERERIQKNTLDSENLNLKSELKQLGLTLSQLNENFKLSKELLELERSNLNFLEREYRNGKVTYLDLVTGLKDYGDAQLKYFSSLSELRLGHYSQMYQKGILHAHLAQ